MTDNYISWLIEDVLIAVRNVHSRMHEMPASDVWSDTETLGGDRDYETVAKLWRWLHPKSSAGLTDQDAAEAWLREFKDDLFPDA